MSKRRRENLVRRKNKFCQGETGVSVQMQIPEILDFSPYVLRFALSSSNAHPMQIQLKVSLVPPTSSNLIHEHCCCPRAAGPQVLPGLQGDGDPAVCSETNPGFLLLARCSVQAQREAQRRHPHRLLDLISCQIEGEVALH